MLLPSSVNSKKMKKEEREGKRKKKEKKKKKREKEKKSHLTFIKKDVGLPRQQYNMKMVVGPSSFFL